jgi:uncharacterized protein (TIGR00661 family)
MQAPKIIRAIRREHTWLQQQMSLYGFDAVISDNRFGLYFPATPSIFITHQLFIQAPYPWLAALIRRINYRYINRFHGCWVPDFETGNTMAGKLSHPAKLPAVPVTYIGPLSRFDSLAPALVRYEWMIILSGPEPQRTILEKKLLAVAPKLEGEILLVRGKPGSKEVITAPAKCTVVNHLATAQMQEAIASSNYIVSRCGYTTVMEMLCLGKKCFFIPTPGQTEQEYLAKHLVQQGWAYYCEQNEQLEAHFYRVKNTFKFNLPPIPGNRSLAETIKNFIKLLEIRET